MNVMPRDIAVPANGEGADYRRFLEGKVRLAGSSGVPVGPLQIHPLLKPHQRAIVQWAVGGGRRAIFASFGLGKTIMQLEIVRLTLDHAGGRGLIVLPLGVRAEFVRDAATLGIVVKFIRTIEEADATGIYLTNYETVRDGKLDPAHFTVVSLDEASVLRGFGGTKTFREFMALFAGDARRAGRSNEIKYRFVATATPSPNEYIELLAYAAFLGVMDVGQAKTRFFQRNSEKNDDLTLYPHKEKEFWLWVASWAVFLQRPSDLGYDDTGYVLPEMKVRWHEVPSDHSKAGQERDGQQRMFRNAAASLSDAARERRDNLGPRVAKLTELIAADPEPHRLIWHDLESERHAIAKAVPDAVAIWGKQDLEEREQRVADFSDGKIKYLAAKPVLAGSGCNFQRHCHKAIFLGVGYKFNDFIQACYRIQRFLQGRPVEIDIIYSEAERDIRATLEEKWARHNEQAAIMSALIREYGLASSALADTLTRTIGAERREVAGEHYRLINNDCVEETRAMPADSVDFIVTSIPFEGQYEYTPSYNDFGHTENSAEFWAQMGYLIPELLRVLKPGRVCAIHVKDRITPGGINGFGFQTVTPISDYTTAHFTRHGFAFLARKTVVTDVVRENNQTYRLGWTEQCKDGSRMGAGLPEYLMLFRKPPTDRSNGYADHPVVKTKPLSLDKNGNIVPYEQGDAMIPGTGYSRSRWQIDAHGFTRSNGNRFLQPADLVGIDADAAWKLWQAHSLSQVYDFEHHVACCEAREARKELPKTFFLMPPHSWHPDVWTDVTRMRTLNGAQHAAGRELHICLARGSRVLTRRAGYVPIEEVAVGDEVLTHRGRWRPVLLKQNTGVRPVVTVKAHGVPGLTLTPDHKLWTRPVRNLPWSIDHSRREAQQAEPQWVGASETVGSYVNLKLPPAETPGVESLRHWWTVGRWLADGHFSKGARSWVISCGHHELDYLIARLGEHGSNKPHDVGTGMQIILRTDRALRDTLKACGTGAAGKHLPPEAFTLPLVQARALLDGYLSGYGHLVPARQHWMATSVSRDLLLGIALLAQRAYGAIASIYPGRSPATAKIQGRIVSTKQEWILSFDIPGERYKGQPLLLEDGAWKKVRSAAPCGEVETWNLRVAEDESFTAEGCIVKNCPLQFDIVDRAIAQFTMPGETVLDPFGGLMTVPYRAVLLGRQGLGIELNTDYWRDGQRYCEAAEAKLAVPSLFDLIEADKAADGPIMEAAE
jgi:hypothetical protein